MRRSRNFTQRRAAQGDVKAGGRPRQLPCLNGIEPFEQEAALPLLLRLPFLHNVVLAGGRPGVSMFRSSPPFEDEHLRRAQWSLTGRLRRPFQLQSTPTGAEVPISKGGR